MLNLKPSVGCQEYDARDLVTRAPIFKVVNYHGQLPPLDNKLRKFSLLLMIRRFTKSFVYPAVFYLV